MPTFVNILDLFRKKRANILHKDRLGPVGVKPSKSAEDGWMFL